MNLRCIIVDDEPLAHRILESYIDEHSRLNLIGNYYNATETLTFLSSNTVDLLFLDINMPEISGIEMLRSMNNPPIVIFTTAYSEFALESYDLGVADYLMKPIRFDRFLKAVNKVMKMSISMHSSESSKVELPGSIFIKVAGAQQKIILADLDYVESQGNFVQLHVGSKRYLTADTLSNFDKRLNDLGFIRIHKSYIVSIKKVKSLQGKMVQIKNKTLPIGNSYRQMVLGKLGV